MVRRLSAGGTRIRTLGPSLWSCCFWREQERRNRRRGRSRRRCLPRGPSVRISFAPAIGLHHTSASLGPSDCTKLDRCSRAVAGLAAGSTAGVATRLSRRAFGCGLVSRLSGRPNNRAQSRNFSARSTSCSPEGNRAEAPASSCLRLAGFGFAVGVWDSFNRIKQGAGTYFDACRFGIEAPQASASSRNADCQFRVTTSCAQFRNWAP